MSTEKKLTAVEQIFLMIENNEVSNLAEMKEWFINLEKQNIIEAFEEGAFDIMHSQQYYNETFKN
jgi:hypothetical protein